MATREAACHCGQLQLHVDGDPLAVSICNCLACQRRAGSAFGMQAGFKADQLEINGRFNDFSRISDEANRKEAVFHFCPDCGSQVFYTEPEDPDLVVVSIGSFADPSFPPPTVSGYDSRRHPWVGLPASVARHAPELWWDSAQPLYDAGKYAEAADKGRELIEERPDQGFLYYNVACCESLAGRTDRAIEHLRRAIEIWRAAAGWRARTPTSTRSRRAEVPGTSAPLDRAQRIRRWFDREVEVGRGLPARSPCAATRRPDSGRQSGRCDAAGGSLRRRRRIGPWSRLTRLR